MDDEDIEWELARMDEAERRREAPPQPGRTVYRPVDPGLAARIFRQMGRPYDPQAIAPRERYYLNGWDDGEEDDDEGYDVGVGRGEGDGPEVKLPDVAPRPGGGTSQGLGPDPWPRAWRPDRGLGGDHLAGSWLGYRTTRDGAVPPSRGGAERPLSFGPSGHDVGAHMKAGATANPYAGGYANGGAEGDMTLPESTQQPATEGEGMKPSDKLVGFLTNYEKFGEKPYKVDGRGNWTVGFGHEIKPGEDFSNGISEADARKLLAKDIQEHADAINQWAADNNLKLTQQQYDALVSLRFNMGSLEGAPKLRSLIISGNATPEQIRREFEDIISDGKKRHEGLWQRRRDEADMFFHGDYRRKELPPPKELFPDS